MNASASGAFGFTPCKATAIGVEATGVDGENERNDFPPKGDGKAGGELIESGRGRERWMLSDLALGRSLADEGDGVGDGVGRGTSNAPSTPAEGWEYTDAVVMVDMGRFTDDAARPMISTSASDE